MSGNLVSIMGITTQGRGGRQSESLPRSSNKDYTIQVNNTKHRCSVCNTLLPYLSLSQKREKTCPFCHAKNSIILLNDVVQQVSQSLMEDIHCFLTIHPNEFSVNEICKMYSISFSILKKILKKEDFSLFKKRKKRSNKATEILSLVQKQPNTFTVSDIAKKFQITTCCVYNYYREILPFLKKLPRGRKPKEQTL